MFQPDVQGNVNEDGGVMEVYREENVPNAEQKNTVKIHLRHSFSMENRDAGDNEINQTVQYLAQENARLALNNQELLKKLEALITKERDKDKAKDIDIYGETTEQKLIRLEKTLESERREKWMAIEKSEKIRVDLVNRERELSEKNEDMIRMQKALAESEEIISQLKNKNQTEQREELSDSERKMRRDNEMEAFKADLASKREIRQNALAAVTSELQNLREELQTEKTLRRKLQQQQQTDQKMEIVSTEEIAIVEALQAENCRLRAVVQNFEKELRSVNYLLAKLKNDYEEEKQKHEKTMKEKMAFETEKQEKAAMVRELETEKEKMWADYDQEKIEVNRRTAALKEVAEISRQMLLIREGQVQELKKKLKEIEESVNNSKLLDQKGLREEYEKQLQNIKTLKELYEERVRLMEIEREKLNEKISQHVTTIEGQKKEIENLKEEYGTTSEELKKEKFQNDSLERDLRLSIARSKDFENELSLINNLFTQMLLGPYNSGNETDLDKLTELLQENHDLITELTLREDSSEIASALPKLLLDLITQVEGSGQLLPEQGKETDLDTISEQSDSIMEDAVLPILSYKRAVVFESPEEEAEREDEQGLREESKTASETPKPNDAMNPAVQEIASNLPKVWRVLMELLSHHTVPDGPPPGDEKQCYKNIETPTGTRSVISVSNTFIRLKDLILEKKALQKELTRLKQLNSHLEVRLDDQEKRLSHVQCELHKTWGIVGRMRAQHQQLHNHERILRYELQEKRIMLSELKQELEYCRDTWERARQKNDESETQWQKLRREFAARKNKSHLTPSLNDSGESGFSDEPNESGEEAENFDADRSSTQSPVERKRSRESSRSPEKAGEPERETTQPSTSLGAIPRTPLPDDEKLRTREARLKRLEDQCQLLVRKVDITTSKSNYLNNRLQELHEQYGSGEGAVQTGDVKTDERNSDESNDSSTLCNATEDKAEGVTGCVAGSKPNRTVEEILSARSERLRRLEEQCQSLVGKVTNTVQRGTNLSNKLEDIHVEYLNSEKERSERQNHMTAVEDCPDKEEAEPEGATAAEPEEKTDKEGDS